MKSKTIYTITTILALFTGQFLSSTAVAQAINVNFDKPENFSDFEEDGFYTPGLLEHFKKEALNSLKKEASEYLPADGKLTVTFHDIDLAGEYEPWRRNMEYVRIMREIYPPRLKFEYRVTDASGKTIAQGYAQLTDLIYLWNLPRTLWTNETFEHEKRLLETWASQKLPGLIENGEGVSNTN